GADAAALRTPFMPTTEPTAAIQYRQALVRAEQDETVRTRAYTGKPLRALKNPYIAKVEGDPSEQHPFPQQLMISSQRNVMAYWREQADPLATCFPAGQGVGGFREIKPAGGGLRGSGAEAGDAAGGTCWRRSSPRPRR